MLRKTVSRVAVCRVVDELIGVDHLVKRHFVVFEKSQCNRAILPRLISTSPVLADQIVLSELVPKIVFDTRTTRCQSAPQRILANVVHRVRPLSLLSFAVGAVVSNVGWHSHLSGVLLIVGDDPRATRFH